jgi:hypothetical protein
MGFLFLLLFTSCMNQHTTFLDKVLNDFNPRHSWFLVIDVKSSHYNGPVVIENAQLFWFYNQTKKLNEKEYQAFAKEKLKTNAPFDIGSANLSQWDFLKAPEINSVNQNARKGVDGFIKTYFDDYMIKAGVSENEKRAIIRKLFEWKIACVTDDESGYLVISR